MPTTLASPRNLLLAALPPDARARLTPHLELLPVYQHDVFHEEGQPLSYAWFLESGVASWLNDDGEGGSIEVATIGNEGLVGICTYFGGDRSPGTTVAQVAGSGHRIPANVLCELLHQPGPLREVVGRYIQALMAQMAQTAVCNRVHPVNERCARWLLITHDRVEGDTFTLTHEFLASMLGVRRASVTVAAGALAQAGLITYYRGHITVLERNGLEDAACECYAIVRRRFVDLIGASTG